MKKIALALALIALFAISSASAARQVFNLNRSWKFERTYADKGVETPMVTLPHTWNQDALIGKVDYYRGLNDYTKTIEIPADWKGKKLYLRFKGVCTIANVFVNGKHQMEHRGAYTAFAVDITNSVKYGATNQIMVRVSNAPTLDIMPLVGDFNLYGGIYRDVELIMTEPSHVSLSDFGSYGMYITQNTTDEEAKVSAKVEVESDAIDKTKVKVEIVDDKNNVVAEGYSNVTKRDDKSGAAVVDLSVKNPNLWNGVESPYLYTVNVMVEEDGKTTDKVSDKVGFRYFSVDKTNGFFLNGKHLKLKGVCRHQDRLEIGNALMKMHHEEDMAIISEMGANAIRVSHYPQDKYFYDLCDQYGLVVWAEIPFVGNYGFVDQPSFRQNGKQQLIEMIRQNYNHPSICFWGMFNELLSNRDNPAPYVRELNALAHKEDPTRQTTSATHVDGEITRITDVMAWNRYFGWYGGDVDYIGKWADSEYKKREKQPIAISEYGAGGSIMHQQEELVQHTKTRTLWHPENWQTHYHEVQWREIDKRDFIWGSFLWSMFDFGAAPRREGEVGGKNDKGLVTFDRKVRKDAFFFYKANWNEDDKFVYIAERRLTERLNPIQKIKIFSNCKGIELIVNGESMGKIKEGDYGTYIWENVKLVPGKNHIKAISKSEKQEDEIVVNLTDVLNL